MKSIIILQTTIYKLAIILLILLPISSCDSVFIDCSTYDFSDCTYDEPSEALLYINLSYEPEFDSVRVTIFDGDVEDKDTIESFIADYHTYDIWLKVNKDYSGTAEYFTGNKVITVIDGDKLRTQQVSRCEESCYIIKGDELNLQLKFNNL